MLPLYPNHTHLLQDSPSFPALVPHLLILLPPLLSLALPSLTLPPLSFAPQMSLFLRISGAHLALGQFAAFCSELLPRVDSALHGRHSRLPSPTSKPTIPAPPSCPPHSHYPRPFATLFLPFPPPPPRCPSSCARAVRTWHWANPPPSALNFYPWSIQHSKGKSS